MNSKLTEERTSLFGALSYKIENLKVRANSYNLIGYQVFPQDVLLLLWKEIGFFSKIIKIW